MEGSTTQATVRGEECASAPSHRRHGRADRVLDAGRRAELHLTQQWPAAFEQPFVAVEKIGNLQLSAQLPTVETVNADGSRCSRWPAARLAAGDG
jgi:hypothetical protein